MTNTIMPLKAIIMTHDDEESDQRLIIDEEDRNNNEPPKSLSYSRSKTQYNGPINVTKSSLLLKIKTEKQLDTSNHKHERLNNVVSGSSMDSQLRKALEKGPQKEMPLNCSSSAILPVSTTISLSSTPLLAASLSRPPVASPSSSLATLASAAVAASATSSTININGNAVDLSQRKKKVYGIDCVEPITYNNDRSRSPLNEPFSLIKDNSKVPLRSPSEVYANLLMQLRNAQARINNGSRSLSPLAVVQQVQDQIVQDSNPTRHSNVSNCSKLTAAARKEKLRLQPSFQCPVCKKRFQRHIAMNAHFQNEHIGSTASDKLCKLCTYVCPDITGIRSHLLTKHYIDLDSPSACLVEGESSSYEHSNGVKQPSGSSPPSPSSSSSPSQTIHNTDNFEECCYKSKRVNRGKSRNSKSGNPTVTYQCNKTPSKSRSSLRSSAQKERVDLPDTAGHDESSSSSLTSNLSSSCSLSAVDAITSSSIRQSPTLLINVNSSALVDDKTSSKYIKQEPTDENLNFRNSEQENYDEAKDLTIKKVPLEIRPSSSVKRTSPSPSNCNSATSDKLLILADVECTPMSKKLKTDQNPTSEDPLTKLLSHKSDDSKLIDAVEESVFQFKCQHCSILFPNQTLYFLHRGFHSEGPNPWRCNGCGRCCTDMYDFNTHLMSDSHG
jgi:Pyruvate/2-oxoacid:ferredoxin oxidoreductase delta subunit